MGFCEDGNELLSFSQRLGNFWTNWPTVSFWWRICSVQLHCFQNFCEGASESYSDTS